MRHPHHHYDRSEYPQVTGQLFRDVQAAGLFSDYKTFVDAEPTTEPAEIRERYRAARDDPAVDLAEFVDSHFDIPEEQTGDTPVAATMAEHIDALWAEFLRSPDEPSQYSSRIDLPHEYVVAGGRFREPYYWDTYFTCEGLVRAGHTDVVERMAKNFAHLVETIGFVPNGARVYYLSRSQPPLFYRVLTLLAEQNGVEAIAEYVPALEAEYQFWMAGADALAPETPAAERAVRVSDDVALNRYWDSDPRPRPEEHQIDRERADTLDVERRAQFLRDTRAACESGWDFSSRWFADADSFTTIRTTDLVPVDLNALLYDIETKLADWTGDASYETAAEQRRDAIETYCWNADAGMYADYRWTDDVVEAPTLAGVLPLYSGVASDNRAAQVAETLRDDYLQDGGLVTTQTETGEQWDWPHGWAPLQWMAIRGLEAYGHTDLAREIASRWVSMCRDVYQQTGLMAEKYDVVNAELPADDPGEYPVQEGFGWTNGVVVALQDCYDLE